MTPKELAEKINGIEYRVEVDRETITKAKESNLVIVFGASDDLIEFRGAISDEIDCWGGCVARFDSNGLIENKCESDNCPYFAEQVKNAKTIAALWCKDKEYSWTYETDIPHESFDIVEDDRKYCRGIVFSMKDIT